MAGSNKYIKYYHHSALSAIPYNHGVDDIEFITIIATGLYK